MWKIKKIDIKNLGTFKSQCLEIAQDKTFLVTGINNDDDGQESNGSGKSWLLESIAIGILGDSLKKVTLVDLIRNGEKSCIIKISLYNNFLKREMEVERTLNRKSSSTLSVKINGYSQSDKFPTVPEGDKFILKEIGISREDLLSYYLISKRRYKSFFSSSDTIKKEIISRFSGADLLNGIEEKVGGKIGLMDARLTEANIETARLGAKLEVYKEDLVGEKERNIDEEKEKIITTILEQIQLILERIINREKKIKELEEKGLVFLNEIRTNNTAVENINVPNKREEITSLREKIKSLQEKADDKESVLEKSFREYEKKSHNISSTLRKEVEEKLSEKGEYEVFLSETKNKIEGSIKCPKCFHDFNLQDKDFSVEDAKKLIPEMEKSIDLYIEVIKEKGDSILKEKNLLIAESGSVGTKRAAIREILKRGKLSILFEIDEIEREVKKQEAKIYELEEEVFKLSKKKKETEQIIESQKSNITIDKQSTGQLEKRLKEEEDRIIETKEAELAEKIHHCSMEIDISVQIEEAIEKEIYNESQWLYNFKKFNSFLANQAISTIEGLTNLNLENTKSNLQIKMDGFKLLNNGEIREKITTKVWRNGEEEGLLDKFSEGEKARIELANIISLQQLINHNTISGGLDFLGIDEILASLDAKGVELSADMLNKLKNTVLLITHVGIDTISYENLLKIEKTNTISTIVK